jgi:hypothetical protein
VGRASISDQRLGHAHAEAGKEEARCEQRRVQGDGQHLIGFAGLVRLEVVAAGRPDQR